MIETKTDSRGLMMKHTMKHLMKTTVAICLAAACLSPLKSTAAENKPAAPTAVSDNAAFDLKFPGGTLTSLLGMIERQSGQKPNVVCAADVAGLALPPLDLRSVKMENIFEALRVVMGDDEPLVFGRMGNIYAIERRPVATASRVYYVGHLLKKFKVQDITTAIQYAWKMSDSRVTPQLKFHEETQLLIVKADGMQQGTIKNVLQELALALEPAPAGGPADSNSKPTPVPSNTQ
jgi:hypothetical protein